MFNSIKKLLGFGAKEDIGKLIRKGAVIIDVRTPAEYASGHIRKSVNIPLDALKAHISKLKKDVPVITCCASGMRSRAAKSILKAHGFAEVYNGGSWHNLRKYEK
jgi:rhodanese-related sulfurtransferase